MCNVIGQTPAVDVWAAGVVLLSLITQRYPFFYVPQRDSATALVQIASITGARPLREAMARYGKIIHSMPSEVPEESALREVCAALRSHDAEPVPESCIDLLARMLDPDPAMRITASDALCHPFFAEDPEDPVYKQLSAAAQRP